jgi:hypothetical protein
VDIFFAVHGMPADGQADPSGFSRHFAANDGQVGLLDAAGFELAGKMNVGGLVLGHQQNPRGIFVQPVNDAGPPLTADPLNVRAVMQKPMDQGAGSVPGRRVNHQPRGLVDHNQRLVLEEDAEINRLGGPSGRFGGRDPAADGVTGFDPVAGLSDGAVDPDVPAGDQAGGQRTREVTDAGRHQGIQALVGLLGLDREGKAARGGQGAQEGVTGGRQTTIRSGSEWFSRLFWRLWRVL